MISHFIKLEWKQLLRAAFWQKYIIINIFLVILALIFLGLFGLLGVGFYFIIEEEMPDTKPLNLLNSVLIYALFGDLMLRYFMQKLPVMKIKPLLILPVRKSKIVHYVLMKSSFSFFNIIGMVFYLPFAIVLITQDYDILGVIGWLFSLKCIVLSLNYLNFLVNKNNKALFFVGGLLAVLVGLHKFSDYNIIAYGGQLFDFIYQNPFYSVVFLLILSALYFVNYKQLRNHVYLDEGVNAKVEKVNSANLSWTKIFGDVAPFIKNDIRLIWRNKRTKTVFLMSFFFLFYGLMFFTQEAYSNQPAMLMFASLFITGGFALNYGQFIPAWDSEHYKMLMSQSFIYRKFLDSKWVLMVIMTTILYVLSVPYLYFGTEIFLMISVGAIFNIGFNSLFLLYAGSYNRKRIDLTKSGFSNMQGTSAKQFLIIIPLMLFPMLLFWILNEFVGHYSGFIAVAVVGLIGLLFKNYFMNLIEKRYINDKYKMINAFGKEA